jgi:hypothetical protein
MFFGKVSDDFNPAETFFNGGRHELGRHPIENLIGNQAGARCVAGFADGERNIEEQSVYFASMPARKCDEWPSIAAREIGRIYIGDRAEQCDALF